MFNPNFFHNLFNVLIAIMGLAAPILVATGCVHDPLLDKFDCSQSWIPPLWVAPILGALGALKIVMNLMRDGLGGLIKVQPPVADATATVTTPIVVAGTKQAEEAAKAQAAKPR